MNFKIGDKVYHRFTDAAKGVLIIVGNKDEPYKHDMLGDIYPNAPNDTLSETARAS